MRLVYEATGEPVNVGDTPTITRGGVVLQGIVGTVVRIEEPTRPTKPGKVHMRITPIPSGEPVDEFAGVPEDRRERVREFFEIDSYRPSEIGAVWR